METKKTFFVYWDKPEPHVKIHLCDCSYCNYGKGIHNPKGKENSGWKGPFETYQKAKEQADIIGSKKNLPVTDCSICKPNCIN